MIMRMMIIVRHWLTMPMPMIRVNMMTVLDVHRHTGPTHVNQRDGEQEKTMEQATHRYPTALWQILQPPRVGENYRRNRPLQGKCLQLALLNLAVPSCPDHLRFTQSR